MRSEVVPSRVLRSRWWSQWVLVVVMLLSSSGLAVAAPLWQSQATATVVIASLNVRSGPATSYARVAGVKKGDVLTVLGQSGNCAWLKIATPQKQEGWVSGAARYVTLNVKCSAIPAASATAGTASAPAAATGNQAANSGNAAPAATPAAATAPVAQSNWMSPKDVQTKLEAAGYTDFREIEREKNKYEVKATDPQGQRVELDVDPVTGDVLKTEVKRSK